MKRALLILLSVFYLGIASGATVHFHYCMGELVRLGLTEPKESNCNTCGMTPKEGSKKSCCKSDYKQAKVDKSQKNTPSYFEFKQMPVVVVNAMIWETSQNPVPFELGKAALSNAPPEGLPVPVFIRNCTYRI
jgi:hypothetical protein